MKEIRELTKAEEEVMQILWDLGKAFVKEILEQMPEPKPAYNTVSTIVRILESKQFVGYTAYGKSHQYFPLVAKADYKNLLAGKLLQNYFNNSTTGMLSFFIENNKMDANELEEILELIKKNHS